MKTPLLILLLFASGASWSHACDLCGCYTPQLETMPDMEQTELFPKMKGWYAAVAEQFTRFATVQLDGHEVANPTGQYENSSITQFIASKSIRLRASPKV